MMSRAGWSPGLDPRLMVESHSDSERHRAREAIEDQRIGKMVPPFNDTRRAKPKFEVDTLLALEIGIEYIVVLT